MTVRRSLSPMRRLKVFEDAGGACHICGLKIRVGEPWDVEHVIPLALGGEDMEANMRPAHKLCHNVKTIADASSWSKAKRMKASYLGIKKRSTFPCARGGKFKQKIGGRVVLR